MKYMKLLLFAIVVCVLIFVDQYTKILAYNNLKVAESYVVIKDILEFTYVENTGAAFGILKNKQMFFYILTVIVLIFIMYLYIKTDFTKHNLLLSVSLMLIFAGACGNFIDRVRHKYVIDYIYFKPIDFPVFNFADICITIGTVILFVSLFTIYKDDNII